MATLAVALPQTVAVADEPLVSIPSIDLQVPDPGTVTLTSNDTTRFVTLWDARFRSGPAFQAYLDSDAEYDDGYNDLPPEQQGALVRALVNHWRANDPAFAAHVRWDGTTSEEGMGPRPTADQVLGVVNAIVFHKEAFKAALREPAEPAAGGAPTAPSEPPTVPADPLGEAAAAELAEATAAAATSPGLGALDLLADGPDRLPEKLAEAVPHEVSDRLPTSGDITGVDLGELGETLAELVEPLGSLGTARETAPTGATSYAPRRLGPENLTYGVCWQLPSTAETCSSLPYVVGILVAVPPAAAQIDLDGNLLPDLEVSLVIDPLTHPGGLAATVRVRRLTAAAANARGIVRYRLPDSDKELRVGFDGRAAGLQADQNVTVLVESLAGLSTGDARLRSSVSHSGAPGATTVALETSYLGGATPDSLATVTTFERAPSSFTARLEQRRAASTATLRVEATHGGSVLPDVTVDARGRLGQALHVGQVAIQDVPSSVTVSAVRDESARTSTVTYDATSSVTRAGAFLATIPNVGSPGEFQVAGVSLDSLPRRVAVSSTRDGFSVSSNAPAGRLVASYEEYASSLLARRAFARLSSTPSSVSTVLAANAQRYVIDSGTTGIQLVEAAYLDKTLRLDAAVTVKGFPGHAELTMPTSNDARIAWTASAPIPAVTATATYSGWRGHLHVTNVPASMSFVPGTGGLDVSGTGATGTTISAYLTNHNQVLTSPVANDNYVIATRKRVAVPVGSAGTMNVTLVSAAVHITNLVKVRVTPGTTTTLDLQAGGGAPLYVKFASDDLVAKQRAFAEARLVNFPGSVKASIGETTTVNANANSDLTATVEFGPIANQPALPTIHGLYLRRVPVSGGSLVRGRIWLTGLPTSATFAPGSITLAGLRPSQPSLEVDVALLDGASPLTAYVRLAGIPVYTTHTITVTWSTTRHATTDYETRLKATTSGGSFGDVTANVSYDRYSASLRTSALPSSMELSLREVSGSTTVGWDASAVLASVNVAAFTRPSATAGWSARASVELTDLPSDFDLVTRRDAGGAGPLITYRANASTLDAKVVADGSLSAGSGSLGANLWFRLVDLASSVKIEKSGSGFALSGGRTAHVEARVSATADYQKSDYSDGNPNHWVRFPWSYNVNVDATVKNLSVVLTSVSSFTVTPGITTGLAGDFGTFHLGYDSFKANLSFGGKLEAYFDIGIARCCRLTLVDVSWATSWNIDPAVRLYEPGWHDAVTRVFCAVHVWEVGFTLKIQPKPFRTTSFTAGIGLTGAPGAWRQYWATPVLVPNNSFWALVSDVVTGAVTHKGNWADASAWKDWWC